MSAHNGEEKDGIELFATPVHCRLKTDSSENSHNQKHIAKNSSECVRLHSSIEGNSYELRLVERMGSWVVVPLQLQPFKA